MKPYIAKTLFTGSAIGIDNEIRLVAVPDFKIRSGCVVWFQGEKMTIKPKSKPLTWRTQPQLIESKRIMGINYIVGYFKWKPDAEVREEPGWTQEGLSKLYKVYKKSFDK